MNKGLFWNCNWQGKPEVLGQKPVTVWHIHHKPEVLGQKPVTVWHIHHKPQVRLNVPSVYSYCMFVYIHRASWHFSPTLTEVLPCFFVSYKANARVKLAKMGHGPHSSKTFCVVLCIVCFVSFCVLYVCKCVLYCCHWVATQLQFNKYHIVSYHIIYIIWNGAAPGEKPATNCLSHGTTYFPHTQRLDQVWITRAVPGSNLSSQISQADWRL